jgi:hypothetical protein
MRLLAVELQTPEVNLRWVDEPKNAFSGQSGSTMELVSPRYSVVLIT